MKIRILILGVFLLSSILLAGGRIVYPGKGNINPEEGTIEMWIRMDFEPQQTCQEYKNLLPLFQFIDPETKAYISISYVCPDGGKACWYVGMDYGGEKIFRLAAIPVGWEKSQWHHIALTWKGNIAKLYFDGKVVNETKSNNPMKGTIKDGQIFIGDRWTSDRVKTDAAIDELRISSVERKPEELGFSGELKPDPYTLVLENFEQITGSGQEMRTKPLVCSSTTGEKTGIASGVSLTMGKFGKGIALYIEQKQ